MTLRTIALTALLLMTLSVPTAQASPDQVSAMMDDDQLLYRGDKVRGRTLVQMRTLGVDVIRATVLWKTVAEGASLTNKEIERLKGDENRDKARAQRKRFKPKDPRTYPTRNWDKYDNLVKDAAKFGMRVYFTITGPGPSYAHRKAPPSQRANAGTYKPFPTRFRDFAEAVGRRYSGTTRDENGIRRALPRVSLWSIWNEPNQPGWLTPQHERRDGQVVPAAPALYRKLYQMGVQGLERSGHNTTADGIFVGETAPLGSAQSGPRNGMKPVPFLRELLCLKPDGTSYDGPDALRRDCDDFVKNGPLKATAFAHHPYTKKVAPTKAPATPDDITIANIGTLGPMLDSWSAQSGGKLPPDLPILLTEFGYESSPPDPRNGIPYLRQAQFNQLAEFLAYNDPRVQTTTHFLLRDVAPLTRYPKGSRLYWFTYQSGLVTNAGRSKPAVFAYALPFVVFPSGEGTTGYWGQLRFRPNGAQDLAVIMWRPDSKSPWQQVGEPPTTTARGYFTGTIPTPGTGGEYRAVYVNPETGRITHSSLPA
ncbi:MAG TPA: hypothetical protein VNA28_09710, partial [Solirubrobacteraceae bacterium]|nr:hypothetical protein [Solirubrobacteraceae bacterium]